MTSSNETIENLLQSLLTSPIVINIAPPSKPKFYAHVDINTHDILGISPSLIDTSDPSKINLEIDYDLAEKFLTGQENIFLWCIAQESNGNLSLMKREDLTKIKRERVEYMEFTELVPDVYKTESDILVNVDSTNDIIYIHYNGDFIKLTKSPVNFYFTGEQNPTQLKGIFKLSADTLDKMLKINKLAKWPNPIVLKINDASNLSIYTIKSNISISMRLI